MLRTTTFYLIICGAISILGFYNFAVNYSLENKICQLSNILKNTYHLSDLQLKDSITSLQIENNSYSDQLNRQSDQFIYYSSALFFILGLFGITVFYRIIDVRLREAKNTVYKSHRDQKEDYERHKKDFKELEKHMLLVSGNSNVAISMLPNMTPSEIVSFRINAAHSFRNLFKLDNLITTKDLIINNLNEAKQYLPLNIQYAKDRDFDPTFLLENIKNIRTIDDDEILRICLSIITELNRHIQSPAV